MIAAVDEWETGIRGREVKKIASNLIYAEIRMILLGQVPRRNPRCQSVEVVRQVSEMTVSGVSKPLQP